jgi:hypothetical protein
MPFEIKRVCLVLWRRPARFDHRVGFLKRNIEDAHLARGGDVARAAALARCRRLCRHRDRLRIFKTQQTPRKVRVTISA